MSLVGIGSDQPGLEPPGRPRKNRRAHIIHLSDLAMEIIESLPRIDNSYLVFTINGQRSI